jgi:Arc/MetJ-type ribon-helix-helix transcriptional regulator
MGSLSRFTVSLPRSLLRAVDEKLIGEGETRSALIRRLLEEALRDAREQALREARERADIERYIRGWQEQPLSDEDFIWSPQRAASPLLALPEE